MGVPARMNPSLRRSMIPGVREQFRLEWQGIHGVPHWARVRCNGLAMARVNGARIDIVEWFALPHESQRFHDERDWHHGARGAESTREPNSELLRLDWQGFVMLAFAVRHHSDGLIQAARLAWLRRGGNR